jgi:iron complex outermembrane receptor protein
MYKPLYQKREVLVFRQFQRKGYSLFACLGREVIISVLSVATLQATKAATISDEIWRADSTGKATKEIWLGDIGVTGSRAPLTKSQTVRMVTVLSRDDIQAAPVQSINDLLKMAVGVDVRQRGTLGAQTDIGLRGGTAEQIAILLNGINIGDPQTAHNTMDLPADLSDIVRIEVLEGPAGRTYGTSSLVGAINIVTHPRQENSIGVNIEAGSYGYAKAMAKASMSKPGLNNQLSGSYMRSDGFSRSASGTLNTDYRGSKAFYQGEYDDNNMHMAWHFGVTDKGWGASTFYASPKWQADDQYEHTTKLMTALQAQTKKGFVKLRPAVYWNLHRDRYEGYRGRQEKMSYNYNRCNVYGINMNCHLDWMAGRTAFGAEIRNEELVSGNLGEPLSEERHITGTDRNYTLGICRTNLSAHIEHNILLKNITISAGMIAMKSSQCDMDWQIYPGIDVSYRLSDVWKLYAGYNSSVRLPSFTEMYYKLQGYAANPHLKPEEMTAAEVGTSLITKGLKAKVSLFLHHGGNLIDWTMDTSLGEQATWQSVNHTRINSYGIETSAELALKHLLPMQKVLRTLQMEYSFMSQDKVLETGIISQYALEYLQHKMVARLQTTIWKKLNLGLYCRWQKRMGEYTDFYGNVHKYSPFAVADARLSWTTRTCSFYADVNNLLNNKDIVDYGNVPQPGINIIVGVKASFHRQ